ncbi:hypothetical protein ACJX0J_011155, partial [Zea mays]
MSEHNTVAVKNSKNRNKKILTYGGYSTQVLYQSHVNVPKTQGYTKKNSKSLDEALTATQTAVLSSNEDGEFQKEIQANEIFLHFSLASICVWKQRIRYNMIEDERNGDLNWMILNR